MVVLDWVDLTNVRCIVSYVQHLKIPSLDLALTLTCLKTPNHNLTNYNPNPLTLIQPMNLIKAQPSSKIRGVSVHVMNINEVALTRP